MKVEYIEPIYMAAARVFKNMFQADVKTGEIEVKEDFFSGKKVNISIGVTGDLKGTILFSFAEQMALDIVAEMAGMQFEKLDRFVTSAVGELANIISGQAMTNFFDEGINCDIVPPQVTVGDNISITMVTDKVLSVSVKTPFGEFEVNVSLKEV